MTPRPPLPAGPFLVVGLARSGVGALRVLRALGEEAIGVDSGSPEVDLPDVHLGADGLALLDAAGAVVKSPGVPAEAAVIAAARERGVPVLGEVELAWRLLPNEFIAITGTNGKTTTTELVGHIHREAGVAVEVAGNVGTALTSLIGTASPEAVVVCEVSSFQLEDTLAFAPEAAVLLNLEADHLDRHGTFERYREAKLQAFARQGPEDLAVVAAGTNVPGAGRRIEPADITGWELGLRGAHNRANAAFAAAVCLARGVPEDAVRAGLRTFAGVEHRLEDVATVAGVLYVNDSKATNVVSTLMALASFDAPVHVILGGQGKGQDFSPLRGAVDPGRAYLIGEDGREIGAAIGGGTWCGDLETAVAAARAAAQAGDVVLLSPACASFDQYSDYEARGRRFKELVG